MALQDEFRAKADELGRKAREAADAGDDQMARVWRSGERSWTSVADRAEGRVRS